MTQYMPETPDDTLDELIKQHTLKEVDPMPYYPTRIERRQKWALAAMALLLLVACMFAALTASAQEARTATISFTAPTHYTDGTPIPAGTVVTYGVFQGQRGGIMTRVATITDTSTTINTGLEPREYCWTVTAIIGGTESAHSNHGCKSFLVPQAVVITVT